MQENIAGTIPEANIMTEIKDIVKEFKDGVSAKDEEIRELKSALLNKEELLKVLQSEKADRDTNLTELRDSLLDIITREERSFTSQQG